MIASPHSGTQLCWEYMGDMLYTELPAGGAEKTAGILESFRPETGKSGNGPETVGLLGGKLFTELRGRGLCRLL